MGRTSWGLLGASLVAVAGAGWAVGSASQSPDQAAARASEPVASWITATVERRALASTVILRGDVFPEYSIDAAAPASVEGVGVVTRVVVRAGAEVVEGDTIAEVSGRPVIVLNGAVPVYRTLRPSMSGADVRQLQEALVRLGYAVDVDGIFGESTKTAVTQMYENAGYLPVPASETEEVDIAGAQLEVAAAARSLSAAEENLSKLEAGSQDTSVAEAQIALEQARRELDAARAAESTNVSLAEAELNSAVRARDRLATSPDATAQEIEDAQLSVDRASLGLDTALRTSAESVANATDRVRLAELALDKLLESQDTAAAERDLVAAQEAKTQADSALAVLLAAAGPTVPQGEVLFVPVTPARVISAISDVGVTTDSSGGSSSGATGLVKLAAGRLVVRVPITSDDREFVVPGTVAELLDEASSVTFQSKVVTIADQPTSNAEGRLVYEATLATSSPLPDATVGSNLRVTLTVASTSGKVLAVPLVAVSSGPDGTIRVAVVDDPLQTEPTQIEVIVGISANGLIEVEPVEEGSLEPGDLVVVGR